MIKNSKLILQSLGHAVLVFLYTAGVAWIMFNGKRFFGEFQNFLGPVLMLLAFVLSAAIVGTLVLGRPILLYLNGFKTEAMKFFACTLGWILVIILAIFLLRLYA
jgi:hypothetical protein